MLQISLSFRRLRARLMILLGKIYHVRTLSEKLVRRSEDMFAVLLLHGCDLENAMNFLARSVGQLRKALEAV